MKDTKDFVAYRMPRSWRDRITQISQATGMTKTQIVLESTTEWMDRVERAIAQQQAEAKPNLPKAS